MIGVMSTIDTLIASLITSLSNTAPTPAKERTEVVLRAFLGQLLPKQTLLYPIPEQMFALAN